MWFNLDSNTVMKTATFIDTNYGLMDEHRPEDDCTAIVGRSGMTRKGSPL